MWDLGGQDRFRFIQGEYIKGAAGCFVLFDMSRYPTLEACREWCALYRQNAPNAPIVLVGTKLDLIDQATFDSINQSATAMAQELGCLCFIPTSAKLGVNVNESIQYLVDLLLYQSYNLEHGRTAVTQ
jgi:GTPase SAR1 family protein